MEENKTKQKDGFYDETICKFIPAENDKGINEAVKELILPICR